MRKGNAHATSREGGSSLWPNIERETRSYENLQNAVRQPSSKHPGAQTKYRIFDVPVRLASVNATREHYESSKQPMLVSQQTSASAVRDMALRKSSSPKLHESTSTPMFSTRPLKSALRKQNLPELPNRRHEEQPRAQTSSSDKVKKGGRLDLSMLFPRPRTTAANVRANSPNAFVRTPSTMTTDSSDFFPRETMQVQLKRPTGNGRYETYKSVKTPSPTVTRTTREKVFEADIFDNAKTNVRRPPKGIQNWFDGFDISSEEDDESDLEREAPQPAHELPANEATAGGAPLSSRYSHWGVLKPDNEQPALHRKASRDPVEDNMLAIEHAKERMNEKMRTARVQEHSPVQKRDSSVISELSAIPSEDPSLYERKQRGESRLANSRLAVQSVLALSDSDSDEGRPVARLSTIRDTTQIDSARPGNETQAAAHKPRPAVKRLHSARSLGREPSLRQSSSTVQTSAFIPIGISESAVYVSDVPLPTEVKRQTQNSTAAYSPSQALRKLNGLRDSASTQAAQDSRSRRTTVSQGQAPSEQASESGKTVRTETTTSTMPMDASHMMAVTEEEMILLEMMRQKRLAMQKNSFTEGYQLALKREEQHLVQRRQSAQQTALKLLRQKEAHQEAKASAAEAHAQRLSKVTEDCKRGELVEQQRRKYSHLRREDVDNALRLDRFLAGHETLSPVAAAFPNPPASAGPLIVDDEVRAPSMLPQKFELLMPLAYSPASSTQASPVTRTEPVSATDSSPVLRDDDIDDHHLRVRAFLAATDASESGVSMFPTPPTTTSKITASPSARRAHRRSAIISSPSPVEEEVSPMDYRIPSRSPDQPCFASSGDAERRDRRKSISGRRLSSQHDKIDAYEIAAEPKTKTSKQASYAHGSSAHESHRGDSPYVISPLTDFTPIDFSGAQSSIVSVSPEPATPGYMISAPSSDRPTLDVSGSSDNASLQGWRAYTPDTDLTSLSMSTGPMIPGFSAGTKRAAAVKKAPPKLEIARAAKERENISNRTSAGEDVLAAWAELGGGIESLVSRRRAR